MNLTTDLIEGIIMYADKHRKTDRQDIAQAILDIADMPEDLEADEVVKYLENVI